MRCLRVFALALLIPFATALPAQVPPPDALVSAGRPSAGTAPFWSGISDPASFNRVLSERLAVAQQTLDRLLLVKAPHTVENTLRPYDDVLLELDAASSQAELIQAVHPDDRMREEAERLSQKAAAFATQLTLNRALYDALLGIDLSKADAETRYYVQRTLRDFRLAGVDKDDPTRERVKALREQLVQIGQEFDRNIRTDVRTVTVSSAADLEGLPADYIARHKADPGGAMTLTIDYPDSLPVFSYARNEDVRKRMYMEYNNRAYPQNIAVLNRMIATRTELARLLGYRTWADYITADKMIETAGNASNFIDRILAASGPKANAEFEMLLKRKQQDSPGATTVNAWESTYYSEQVRKASYDFDSQTVRPYFAFDRVKQGLFEVTSRLFGISYKPVTVPVWDRSVEAYEVWNGNTLVGRFYLDMHPRPNKYNHAAQFNIRTGVAARQIPEAALVCNLPGGQPGDPGLMTHSDMITFFHEFGHLLHALLAGHHQWIGIGGNSTEQDFVEAPSQMLEEWTWDPATLATFATHYQTNEPIPAALVRQMRRADEFAKALSVRQQMVYAKLSLSLYDRDPNDIDPTAMVRELTNKYRPFPYVEGTHFETSFTHLNGYSAVYYTYMWSLVIAKDMFSQFDRGNLLAPAIAHKYRDAVLVPGGSRPAREMLQDFLGRPTSFTAWEDWLNRDQPG
jgi:thimet oligopeptidase